jgi:hypothetical protein
LRRYGHQEPPTARELAEIVMREPGLAVEDLKLLRVMQGRVGDAESLEAGEGRPEIDAGGRQGA